jgi:hypothetical protein
LRSTQVNIRTKYNERVPLGIFRNTVMLIACRLFERSTAR